MERTSTDSLPSKKPEFESWYEKALDKAPSKVCAECFACMFFHLIGSMSPTPWANGLVLTCIVYYTAKISGAHLNPALSFTFFLLGHLNPIELIVYWVSQITGCVLGALLISALVPGCPIGMAPDALAASGCFNPRPDLTDAQVMFWEMMSTFAFISMVFSVVWYSQNKSGYGSSGPLMVGISLTACGIASANFTGSAMNPARALASAIVFKCNNSHQLPLYIAGEMLAALLSPLSIVPWYGICDTAWYLTFLSDRTLKTVIDHVEPVIFDGAIKNKVLQLLPQQSQVFNRQTFKDILESREESREDTPVRTSPIPARVQFVDPNPPSPRSVTFV